MHELCAPIDRMLGDAAEHMTQIGLGIEAVSKDGTDQMLVWLVSVKTSVPVGSVVFA